MSYNKYYSEWAENPLSFWDEKAKDVSWIEHYKKTLHRTDNYYEWFHQGKLNTCYNCVDKHVENENSEDTTKKAVMGALKLYLDLLLLFQYLLMLFGNRE
jgi:hypothetical protein